MSNYSGYEVVIASDNESTLQQALDGLRNEFHEFYNDEGIKKVGDFFIDRILEETNYSVEHVTDFAKELVEKYGCRIEISNEGYETGEYFHFYYDGEMEEPFLDYGYPYVFQFGYSDFSDYGCVIKSFLSCMSAQAAKVFSVKYELFEKWCGFYPITLGDDLNRYYIGYGYANTGKEIDLSEYNKFVIPEEEKSIKNNEDYKGKTIRSLDSYGEETIDEYDNEGLLVYHKDPWKESWWDGKGQLIHTKTDYLETFYEYDDNGRLQREYYTEGYEITYEYNPKGLLIEEKDSEGHRAVYSYVDGKQKSKICFNSNGQIVYEKNYHRSFRWCGYNNQDSFIEEWHGYDDKGRIIYEIGGAWNILKCFVYDSKGNKIIESQGCPILCFYDSKDRVIYSSDDETIFVFDDKARLEYCIKKPEYYTKSKHTVFDYSGIQTREIDKSFDDSSIYDIDGNLLYSFDETNKEHKWFVDGYTYICRRLPDNTEWFEYDGTGNLVRRILVERKNNNEALFHEYDNKNNVIIDNDEWYEYDSSGRLISSKEKCGKETIYEYDERNIPIHKSIIIGGQTWFDYVYNESKKLLSFKSIWGEEGTYICDDENILKSKNLPTQIDDYYLPTQIYDYCSNKVLKSLFSKDKCGKEMKYEYDEEGGYKKYKQNDDGEFVLIDQGKCVDNDYDEDCDILEDLDFDVDFEF